MLHGTEIRPDEIADEWAIRSAFWQSEITNSPPKRTRRERNSKPLILCGHGASMRIENGALVIRDGFTHYPQKQATYRYSRGDLDLPPRIVLLDGSGTLSSMCCHGLANKAWRWSGSNGLAR
jgi:CRISPR-associated protein Cas1